MHIDYDRMAEVFDSTRSSSPEFLDLVVRGVSAVASKGERVLDVGCGTGRFMLPLTEAGIDVCGLDVSSGMLCKARAKGLARLARGDATALPFGDRVFKAVLVTNVLHLVPGWKDLLFEACRVSSRAIISFDIRRDAKDPIMAFKGIMDEKGLSQPRAGPLESEFAEQCPPEFRMELGGYEERKRRGDVLSAFREKTFTFQAELPDDQNRSCMDEFSRRFVEESWAYVNSISMIVWDADGLRDKIGKTTFGYPQARTF